MFRYHYQEPYSAQACAATYQREPFDLRSAADYCSVSQTITCRSRGYQLRVYGEGTSGASESARYRLCKGARLIDNWGYVVI